MAWATIQGLFLTMPPRNMVYIPFCLIFRSVLPKRKSLNTERMNSQSAPASHQDGWRGWDRTIDRLINSQLIYLWSTRQKLGPQDGLEPPTTGFGDQDSTNWTTAEQSKIGETTGTRTQNLLVKSQLLYHWVMVSKWWVRWDSNSEQLGKSQLWYAISPQTHNKFVTVDSIPLKNTVPSVSAALPITPCSDQSIGILLIIQCLIWWTQGNSNPYSSRERAVSWPLDDGSMVPSERLELPTYWLQISCTTSCAMKAKSLTTAPTPADVGGFPRKNMRFETLPRNSFLNSKSNREGRSTHTTIIVHKSRKVNSKKL